MLSGPPHWRHPSMDLVLMCERRGPPEGSAFHTMLRASASSPSTERTHQEVVRTTTPSNQVAGARSGHGRSNHARASVSWYGLHGVRHGASSNALRSGACRAHEALSSGATGRRPPMSRVEHHIRREFDLGQTVRCYLHFSERGFRWCHAAHHRRLAIGTPVWTCPRHDRPMHGIRLTPLKEPQA
jgi:hypothetical protein